MSTSMPLNGYIRAIPKWRTAGSLLIVALTLAVCHAASAGQHSSQQTNGRRSGAGNRPVTQIASNPQRRKGKRRRKRKSHVRDTMLMDAEELFSDFVPLDIAEDENEELLMSALDRLAEERDGESTTSSEIPPRRAQQSYQAPRTVSPATVEQKGPVNNVAPNSAKEVHRPSQQQPQQPLRTEQIPPSNGISQESTFSATHSYQRPRAANQALSQPQRMFPPPAPFVRSVQAAPDQPPETPAPKTISLFPPTTPWIRKFLSSRPKDSLVPIPREYISDGFNLVQLPLIVEHVGLGTTNVPTTNTFPLYKAALQLILQDHDDDHLPSAAVQRAAECLYTLVHARYILSPRGLETVRRVLRDQPIFGRCPRIACRGMPVLPYSEHSDYDVCRRTKSYCCNCGETFEQWDSKTDGAAWGPSFCHLLLMTYGKELMQDLYRLQVPPSSMEDNLFAPSIFGFKVHAASILARQPDVL